MSIFEFVSSLTGFELPNGIRLQPVRWPSAELCRYKQMLAPKGETTYRKVHGQARRALSCRFSSKQARADRWE